MEHEIPVLSMAKRYPRRGMIVNVLLLSAAVLFLVGVLSPMFTLHQLWIFDHTVSVISGLADLVKERQYVLFLLILVFSILLPALKLGVLFYLWNMESAQSARHRRHLHWLSHYGKWSMLDVFVVAVLIVTVKLGAIARVEAHFGLYAFAASVLVTMAVTTIISGVAVRTNHQGII